MVTFFSNKLKFTVVTSVQLSYVTSGPMVPVYPQMFQHGLDGLHSTKPIHPQEHQGFCPELPSIMTTVKESSKSHWQLVPPNSSVFPYTLYNNLIYICKKILPEFFIEIALNLFVNLERNDIFLYWVFQSMNITFIKITDFFNQHFSFQHISPIHIFGRYTLKPYSFI